MRNFFEVNKVKILQWFLIIGFTLFVYIFLKFLFKYVSPFVLGYIISLILVPLVDFLQKFSVTVKGKRITISRGIYSFLSVVLFIVIMGYLGSYIVKTMMEQAKAFAIYLPDYLLQLQNVVDSFYIKYQDFSDIIPVELELLILNQWEELRTSVTTFVGKVVKDGSVSIVSALPKVFMTTLLAMISAFFFTKDKVLIYETVAGIIPKWLQRSISDSKERLFSALVGYLKAQIILMSITLCICVTGLTIMKYPYSLLVGFVISIIDALPVFGSGFVLWPWAFFSLIMGHYSMAVGLMITYAIILVTRQSLEPRVLGSQIGLYPLVTLSSMYIGLNIFGAIGFLIGPVTVIIAKVILQKGIMKTDK